MELTRKEVVELNSVLGVTNYDEPIASRFRYMVSKNLAATKAEIDEINAAFPLPSTFNEYQDNRNKILKKYKVDGDSDYAKLPEDPKKSLDGELNELNEKYDPLLKELKETEKEKEEFLNETVSIPLVKVHLDHVPTISRDNKINGWDIWTILMKVIDDE